GRAAYPTRTFLTRRVSWGQSRTPRVLSPINRPVRTRVHSANRARRGQSLLGHTCGVSHGVKAPPARAITANHPRETRFLETEIAAGHFFAGFSSASTASRRPGACGESVPSLSISADSSESFFLRAW